MLREIHGNDFSVNVHFREEDFTSRIEYLNNADAIVLFGFPIATSNTRPRYYRIVENLDDLNTPVIPISGVHKFFPGDKKELQKRVFDSTTTEFLNFVKEHCPDQKIPTRTDWVSRVLNQNGYDTIMTGDPAWYDPEMIDTSFHKPSNIDVCVYPEDATAGTA